MIADPRTLRCDDPRLQALADLATIVTEAPWALDRAHHARAHSAGLSDEDVLHAIALASYFGHLNRIADAVAVPLDYQVRHVPRPPDPATPPFAVAPIPIVGRPAIELARRPITAAALADWRNYTFHRDRPLPRRQRVLIARWVARWLGDGGISPPGDLTANPIDDALRALAEQVTLAPWQLDDRSYAPLRAVGFDDAALFDVVATASSAGVLSRIEVALAALGA